MQERIKSYNSKLALSSMKVRVRNPEQPSNRAQDKQRLMNVKRFEKPLQWLKALTACENVSINLEKMEN